MGGTVAVNAVLRWVTSHGTSLCGVHPALQYDVFISYSRDDLEWVAGFARQLSEKGLRVVWDEVVVKPGDVLVHAVERAIRDSAHGLLVFSPASVASGWVQQEYASLIQRSIEGPALFIPVVIGDVELPPFAATRYYADFRQVSSAESERLIARIAEALRSLPRHGQGEGAAWRIATRTRRRGNWISTSVMPERIDCGPNGWLTS